MAHFIGLTPSGGGCALTPCFQTVDSVGRIYVIFHSLSQLFSVKAPKALHKDQTQSAPTLTLDDPYVMCAAYLMGSRADTLRKVAAGALRNHQMPCDLYLYETAVPGINKFGISLDHTKRLNKINYKKEHKKYVKFLTAHRLDHRWQALCLEAAIKEQMGLVNSLRDGSDLAFSKYHNHPEFESLPRNTEYTEMMAEEFNTFVTTHSVGLNEPLPFLVNHAPKAVSPFLDDLEKLRNGKRLMVLERINGEPSRVCACLNDDGDYWEKYGRHEEHGRSNEIVSVPDALEWGRIIAEREKKRRGRKEVSS